MEIEGVDTDVGDFLKKLEVCVSLDTLFIDLLIYFFVSELKSLSTEIKEATSRGTLVRFFNSTDDAFSLKCHNDNLGRIINEANVS
jgi:hypothetical protein